MKGIYVSGWLATGPQGVIATTMVDAYLTTETIVRDLLEINFGNDGDESVTVESIREAVGNRRLVSWSDWQVIDREERRRGNQLGKEREKILSVEEMLSILP